MIVHVKKIRSRYVYSSKCNPTAVESLLVMSKHKACQWYSGKVNGTFSTYPQSCGNNNKMLKVIFKVICSGGERCLQK